MKTFRYVTEKDFIKYKTIYENADMLFGFLKEESFIMRENNQESIIFFCPPIFMKYWLDEENRIKTSSFYVGEDNEILAFTMNDYQINLNGDGILFIHEDGNIYYLQLLGDKSTQQFEVSNNGVVVFSQYSKKKDIRVVSKYEHNVWGDSTEIFKQRLDVPFSISLESKASKRDKGLLFLGHKDSFYRLDFDVYKNKWQYDIATLKDFGVGAVIAHDTCTLQDQISFSKFYRTLFCFGDYITITGFPFTKQYDPSDINGILEDLEFCPNIPDFFIHVYNKREDFIQEHKDIIAWYLRNIRKDKKYSKVV